MIKCNDGGPARNHFFITLAEGKALSLKPTGFHSVCNSKIKTYQLKEGNKLGPCYRDK